MEKKPIYILYTGNLRKDFTRFQAGTGSEEKLSSTTFDIENNYEFFEPETCYTYIKIRLSVAISANYDN